MGFNFRKSISLIPGVKLNFSKGGASISAGVPGFRKSINTKGQVTTTASIPGTGFYYTDKKKVLGKKTDKAEKAEKSSKAAKATKEKKEEKPTAAKKQAAPKEQPAAAQPVQPVSTAAPQRSYTPPSYPSSAGYPLPSSGKQIDPASLKALHKMADDTVEWDEIVQSPTPPDSSYNEKMWAYYYALAPEVLNGDIDTYLRLIYEVNPLGDLLEYGSQFRFGTDDPAVMHVEFAVNQELLARSKRTLAAFAYHELLQDFICSLSIRVARDMFALLPVSRTVVHAMLGDQTVLSVSFDRGTLNTVKFGFVDPSDTISKFPHNMWFNAQNGFAPVERLS